MTLRQYLHPRPGTRLPATLALLADGPATACELATTREDRDATMLALAAGRAMGLCDYTMTPREVGPIVRLVRRWRLTAAGWAALGAM